MDLPPGSAASAALDVAEERLRRSEAALAGVPDELDTLLVTARSGAVSFDTPLSPAAAELLDLLDSSRSTPETTSFSLFSVQRDKLEDAGQAFQNALQRLSQMVSRFAYVETSVQGRLVGRTKVGWSGDFESLFPEVVTPEEFTLHQRSLNLELASRRLAVSMIARTAQGAVKVGAYLATPGGVLLALPAIWKYINSILSEIKTYQELHT
jgi:multidrug efflux pump subunit AcrA (membrane-fusion protein)